ncbi:glutathione S-transferase-like isoform X2 [Branchiostoma floridae x Branchiostoma belcheri]
MPTYKLTYFKHWGRGGVLRLLFAAGGIEFEDVRIEREQWPELKPKTPMGQIPILEVDGTMICQRRAIGRLIAKEAGLAGKTPLEEAWADMIVDGLADLEGKIVDFFIEKDEQRKLTWADVDFFAMMFFLKDHLPSDPLQGYVNLTKVRDNVSSHPGIAGWLEKEGASQ